MAIRVRSQRLANRALRIGLLRVVFRGEYAELPDHAQREYAFLRSRFPDVQLAPLEQSVATGPAIAPPASPAAAEEIEIDLDAETAASAATPRRDRRRGR